MIRMKTKRVGLGVALLGLVIGGASLASAHGMQAGDTDGARPQCSGDHANKTDAERQQSAAERFQKADKNGDGFLTADEVGPKRWEHIKVADTNNDQKVSQAELEQAFKDGKIGHHDHKQS
jgi:hypothetical protein